MFLSDNYDYDMPGGSINSSIITSVSSDRYYMSVESWGGDSMAVGLYDDS